MARAAGLSGGRSLHVVRPATTLTIGLLMALILIAGVISLTKI